MADFMDFPLNPLLGQQYTNQYGVVYTWDGFSWVLVAGYVPPVAFPALNDVIDLIRITLQDTDSSASSGFRYTTDSIVKNMNLGMLEMFRIRPDAFLEVGLRPVMFDVNQLQSPWPIEPQFLPAIVYYAVGFTQLRDDEPEQDQRASMFLTKFASMLVAVA